MKNFRLLLTLTLLTEFYTTQTIDKEDRENFRAEKENTQIDKEETVETEKSASQNSASQNDAAEKAAAQNDDSTTEETLPKVKMFQKLAQTYPRIVSNCAAMLKGIANYSSEPQDVKDCAMSLARLIEESQEVTTEEQAQEFAQKLVSKLTECDNVAQKEFETISKNDKSLPYIKFVQQAMETYPERTQQVIFQMALRNVILSRTEENEIVLISTVNQEAAKLTDTIKNITTEEEAQDFGKQLFPFMKMAFMRLIQNIAFQIDQRS